MTGWIAAMTADRLEYFGNSLIQHGPENNRIYLMKLNRKDLPDILGHMHELVKQCGYTKIFAKAPASVEKHFTEAGYRVEAAVPRFYNGKEDGLFLARYYDDKRSVDPASDQIGEVLDIAREKGTLAAELTNDGSHICRLATPEDCRQMSKLYKQVFASYPFPIDNPDYLEKTMAENISYAGIWQDDKLLALASAEWDRQAANAEMTDFATLPEHRGGGLAKELLRYLERYVRKMDIQTCYTIARATSFGMNITFAGNGYEYGGTLINNTQIAGALESMNVWYKPLLPH